VPLLAKFSKFAGAQDKARADMAQDVVRSKITQAQTGMAPEGEEPEGEEPIQANTEAKDSPF
jgi:hypothetical protein